MSVSNEGSNESTQGFARGAGLGLAIFVAGAVLFLFGWLFVVPMALGPLFNWLCIPGHEIWLIVAAFVAFPGGITAVFVDYLVARGRRVGLGFAVSVVSCWLAATAVSLLTLFFFLYLVVYPLLGAALLLMAALRARGRRDVVAAAAACMIAAMAVLTGLARSDIWSDHPPDLIVVLSSRATETDRQTLLGSVLEQARVPAGSDNPIGIDTRSAAGPGRVRVSFHSSYDPALRLEYIERVRRSPLVASVFEEPSSNRVCR